MMWIEYGLCESLTDCFFEEICENAVLGCILRVYVVPWNTYVLYDGAPSFLFLRVSRSRSEVREVKYEE